AVAVVVEAVAGLDGGLLVLSAAEAAGLAVQGAGRADTGVAGVARPAATRIDRDGRADGVGVEAVGGLAGGLLVLGAGNGARLAVQGAGRADTGVAGAAGRAAPRIAVVDRAVAVVVEAVANLDGRLLVLDAGQAAGLAVQGAGRADAGVAGVARPAATR